MYRRKNTRAKLIALILILSLLIGGAVGGTIAWLFTETNAVVNTFAVGKIDLTLTETNSSSIKMVPGTTVVKDPKVTVGANSEECWLFIKIKESGNVVGTSSLRYIQYALNIYDYDAQNNQLWQSIGKDTDGGAVFGRKVETSAEDQHFYILADCVTPTVNDQFDNGCVKISEDISKDDFANVDSTNPPKLTFTAYAIQTKNLKKNGVAVTNAADAWAVYKNPPLQSTEP